MLVGHSLEAQRKDDLERAEQERFALNKAHEAQLKMLQEVITLSVFVPFAVFYMHQPLKLDFLWAGFCLLGAVYFMFRTA